MRNLLLGIVLALGLVAALWTSGPGTASLGGDELRPDMGQGLASTTEDATPPSFEPPPVADPVPARGTTWLVLQVEREQSELVATIHKDALPYAAGPATADAGAVRFRLLEPDGSELTGPASWPRLCPCDAERSHNRGCVRQPHSGSVRLRLPRLSGPSTVVIERRSPSGWDSLTTLEVDA